MLLPHKLVKIADMQCGQPNTKIIDIENITYILIELSLLCPFFIIVTLMWFSKNRILLSFSVWAVSQSGQQVE